MTDTLQQSNLPDLDRPDEEIDYRDLLLVEVTGSLCPLSLVLWGLDAPTQNVGTWTVENFLESTQVRLTL